MPYTDNEVGYKAEGTSKSAAEKVKLSKMMKLVLSAFHSSVRPITADECAWQLGLDSLQVRPRVADLVRNGLLVDSGEKRQGKFGRDQIVWRLR